MSVRPIYKHDHLRPTKRGWLFLGANGGPCDKACKFCYYAYQKQLVFYSLDTLIAHANLFRHHYDMRFCDISGGEATIYGKREKDGRRLDLEKLVHHCASIGLSPTIITHGQNNNEALVRGVEAAGLEDWLISMHGLERGHNTTVVDHKGSGDGGWDRLVAGLKFCERPVRFNTTVQNFNYQELPALAQWLADNRPPTVWNVIQFNPFYAWAGKEVIEFQEKMSTIAPFIGDAVRIAEANGWEVNVRYMPYCVAADHGFAKNCVNFYGTQFDQWEWALAVTNRLPMDQIEALGGVHQANIAYARVIGKGRANAVCKTCRFNQICESIPEQYQARFGLSELKPATGEAVTDFAYFENGGLFESNSMTRYAWSDGTYQLEPEPARGSYKRG